MIAAIRAANQDLPAGSISRAASEQLVRVEGRIKDPRGFERIIVANQGGAPVYLGQVADIVDGEAEEQSIARVDGMRSVSLSVYRAQQANLVKVGAGVEEAIAELQGRLPEDVKIRTLWSDAKWIEGSPEWNGTRSVAHRSVRCRRSSSTSPTPARWRRRVTCPDAAPPPARNRSS